MQLLKDGGKVSQWHGAGCSGQYYTKIVLNWSENDWKPVHRMNDRLMRTVRENAKNSSL